MIADAINAVLGAVFVVGLCGGGVLGWVACRLYHHTQEARRDD
jgi:hypothetical protein